MDGSNRIIIVPGANNQLLPEDAVAAVDAQPRLDAVIGHFEIDPAVTLAAFRAARERGAITILNPAPGHAIGRELAAVCDWVIPNETELAIIARANGLVSDASDPAALSPVAAALGSRLLVTLGKAGAALVTADGDIRIIPAPTVDALDTTGAGDAFVGVFAYALATGNAGILPGSGSLSRADRQFQRHRRSPMTRAPRVRWLSGFQALPEGSDRWPG
jgi:ribokinase